MKKVKFALLAGVVFFSSARVLAKADSFKLVKQDGQVALYERWLQHDGDEVREIKTNFLVHADFKALISLLTNSQKGTCWNINAINYDILPAGSDSWVTHIKYHLPWPLDDQDCCLLFHINSINSQQAEVVFSSVANTKFPISKGVSRITGVKGSWLMEQKNNGSMAVTYTITTDRSLHVPRYFSDAAVHSNLFKTVSALKSMLEKS